MVPGMTMSLNTSSNFLPSSSNFRAASAEFPVHGVIAEMLEQRGSHLRHLGAVVDDEDRPGAAVARCPGRPGP